MESTLLPKFLKKFNRVEQISKSVELNEGDPICIEVKIKKSNNVYRYYGRYVEREDFKTNCLSKELHLIQIEALQNFSQGHIKLSNYKVLRGTKKIWLLREDELINHGVSWNPGLYKKWRQTNLSK